MRTNIWKTPLLQIIFRKISVLYLSCFGLNALALEYIELPYVNTHSSKEIFSEAELAELHSIRVVEISTNNMGIIPNIMLDSLYDAQKLQINTHIIRLQSNLKEALKNTYGKHFIDHYLTVLQAIEKLESRIANSSNPQISAQLQSQLNHWLTLENDLFRSVQNRDSEVSAELKKAQYVKIYEILKSFDSSIKEIEQKEFETQLPLLCNRLLLSNTSHLSVHLQYGLVQKSASALEKYRSIFPTISIKFLNFRDLEYVPGNNSDIMPLLTHVNVFVDKNTMQPKIEANVTTSFRNAIMNSAESITLPVQILGNLFFDETIITSQKILLPGNINLTANIGIEYVNE